MIKSLLLPLKCVILEQSKKCNLCTIEPVLERKYSSESTHFRFPRARPSREMPISAAWSPDNVAVTPTEHLILIPQRRRFSHSFSPVELDLTRAQFNFLLLCRDLSFGSNEEEDERMRANEIIILASVTYRCRWYAEALLILILLHFAVLYLALTDINCSYATLDFTNK